MFDNVYNQMNPIVKEVERNNLPFQSDNKDLLFFKN